jgi:hypothetical protein
MQPARRSRRWQEPRAVAAKELSRAPGADAAEYRGTWAIAERKDQSETHDEAYEHHGSPPLAHTWRICGQLAGFGPSVSRSRETIGSPCLMHRRETVSPVSSSVTGNVDW